MLIVADFASDVGYTQAYEATVIGKYIYFRNDGRTAQLYQNGTLMEFVDAYKSGAIATGDNSISFLVPTAFLGIAALALIHLKKKEM